jgi:glycosyltransferase involved in cell wall biosynthesis
MQSKNNVAIVIVVYNLSSLLAKQIGCIRKFCKDEFDIIVIDNSASPPEIEAIKFITTDMGIRLIKTYSADANGSEGHVFACNFSYRKLKEEYEFFFYLDHDNFPIRDFSVCEILHGRGIAGLSQKKEKTYFWPGCVMWDNRTIDHDIIDFSCDHEIGLDTGGNLYKIVDKYGIDSCVFFNEKYYQNPYFRTGFYNFYSTINDDMFMHFINSSGWNPVENNEERINSLINVLTERIK